MSESVGRHRVGGTKRQRNALLECDVPALYFPLGLVSPDSQAGTAMRLRNIHSTPVHFKIMNNEPKAFTVARACGTLAPGETGSIKITTRFKRLEDAMAAKKMAFCVQAWPAVHESPEEDAQLRNGPDSVSLRLSCKFLSNPSDLPSWAILASKNKLTFLKKASSSNHGMSRGFGGSGGRSTNTSSFSDFSMSGSSFPSGDQSMYSSIESPLRLDTTSEADGSRTDGSGNPTPGRKLLSVITPSRESLHKVEEDIDPASESPVSSGIPTEAVPLRSFVEKSIESVESSASKPVARSFAPPQPSQPAVHQQLTVSSSGNQLSRAQEDLISSSGISSMSSISALPSTSQEDSTDLTLSALTNTDESYNPETVPSDIDPLYSGKGSTSVDKHMRITADRVDRMHAEIKLVGVEIQHFRGLLHTERVLLDEKSSQCRPSRGGVSTMRRRVQLWEEVQSAQKMFQDLERTTESARKHQREALQGLESLKKEAEALRQRHDDLKSRFSQRRKNTPITTFLPGWAVLLSILLTLWHLFFSS